MASDKAIREGSRAWSGGWLSHRLAAAQHLACELSDDVNKAYKPAAPRPSLVLKHSERQSPSRGSVDRLPSVRPINAGLFAAPCPVPRAPCPVPRAPCPVPCALCPVPRAAPCPCRARALVFGLPNPAPIRPERPSPPTSTSYLLPLPLTFYRLNISPISSSPHLTRATLMTIFKIVIESTSDQDNPTLNQVTLMTIFKIVIESTSDQGHPHDYL
ncbi:hypothetical protein TYRP_023412 [Tyrophagus putrescentiae]|nr:hypothetical protein TYRP_023412 [Tyrophagus putrescentiae]